MSSSGPAAAPCVLSFTPSTPSIVSSSSAASSRRPRLVLTPQDTLHGATRQTSGRAAHAHAPRAAHRAPSRAAKGPRPGPGPVPTGQHPTPARRRRFGALFRANAPCAFSGNPHARSLARSASGGARRPARARSSPKNPLSKLPLQPPRRGPRPPRTVPGSEPAKVSPERARSRAASGRHRATAWPIAGRRGTPVGVGGCPGASGRLVPAAARPHPLGAALGATPCHRRSISRPKIYFIFEAIVAPLTLRQAVAVGILVVKTNPLGVWKRPGGGGGVGGASLCCGGAADPVRSLPPWVVVAQAGTLPQ